jgi:hypothetical protein
VLQGLQAPAQKIMFILALRRANYNDYDSDDDLNDEN